MQGLAPLRCMNHSQPAKSGERKKMSNNNPQVIESDDEFIPCTHCMEPDYCKHRCKIDEYWFENTNIAEQRGETPEQLLGENK